MTVTIVGGWYEERCGEPHWHELYGPGGRAAAAISNRRAAVRLRTYCPPDLRNKLQHFAQTFGFSAEGFGTAQAVTQFRYVHWLRPPQIANGSALPEELPPIHVDGEAVIRYGFYEGDAVVNGKRVVFDPQNAGEKLRRFHDNGSSAEELSIVCNFSEGSALSGETVPGRILDILLQTPRTLAVALKGGWEGVWIATRSQRQLVKPTPTRNVHKIGSGDIFTAEFGYGWMILGLDPVEAATRASVQVARYTDSASLPIPEGGPISEAAFPLIARRDGKQNKYDIYIAAPFFTFSQLELVEEMAELFKNAGLVVFSPYHNVGFGHARHIAKQDMDGIRASRILVACLDGYDPGTVFEVGFARALGIPVLIYAPNLSELHSTMFVGSGCEVVRDFTTAVYRAAWWAKSV